MQQYNETKNVFKYCLKRLRRVQCLRPTRQSRRSSSSEFQNIMAATLQLHAEPVAQYDKSLAECRCWRNVRLETGMQWSVRYRGAWFCWHG